MKNFKFVKKLFFRDGFACVVKYNTPSLHRFDELVAKHGIIIDDRDMNGKTIPEFECVYELEPREAENDKETEEDER